MNNNKSIEKLGEIFNKFRKSKMLSQITVGQLSETSQMTVQRLESGKGSGTSIDALLSIAKVLEISLGDIFKEIENNEMSEEMFNRKNEWEHLIQRLNNLPPESKAWLSKLILAALEHPASRP